MLGQCAAAIVLMFGFTATAVAVVPATPANPAPGTVGAPGPVQSSSSVTLSWNASSGATYYGVGVRDMVSNVLVVDTTTTNISYLASLAANGQYRWNVAACNASGCSSYTTVLYFQTPGTTVTAPTPLLPSGGQVITTLSPLLTWSGGSNFTSLQINMSKSPFGGCPGGPNCVFTSAFLSAGTTSTTPTPALVAGTDYRWDVTACSGASGTGTCATSGNATFSTQAASLSDLVVENLLVNPSSMLPGDAITVSFTVRNQGNAAAGPSKTRIRLNTSSANVTTADRLLAEFTTPSLSAGASTPHNVASTIPSTTTPGNYFVWVILDVDNTLNQSNVANDRANKPITVNVPSQPQLSVTPTLLNFGSVEKDTTTQLGFTAKNTGGGTLTGNATTAAPFSIVGDSSVNLAVGESKSIVVQFSPNAVGTFLQQVQVVSNGGGAVVALEGEGGPSDTAATPGTGPIPIIFIPGVYGTELCQNGCSLLGEIWPSVVRTLVVPGDLHLEVLRPNDEGQDANGISPGNIIPNVWYEDIYGDFLGFLGGESFSPKYTVYKFPYDWRLDIEQIANELEDFVNNLTQAPGSQVNIIAHSMGGLVAKAYLSKAAANESKVANIIMIGTPHFGAPKALKALLFGEDDVFGLIQGFADKDRLAHIETNMPSAYQLLPSNRLNDHETSFIDHQDFDEDGKKGGLVYSDLIDMLADQSLKWGRPFLGCILDPHLDIFCHEPLNSHIRTWVSVHERLDGWIPSAGLKAYLLAGTGERTIGGLSCNRVGFPIEKGAKCDPTWAKDERQGDGTVPTFSAEAGNIPGFTRSYFKSKLGECISSSDTAVTTPVFCRPDDTANHLGLLKHSEVRAKIKEILGVGSFALPSSTAVAMQSAAADDTIRWIEVSLESEVGTLRVFDYFGNHLGPPKEGAVNLPVDRGQYFEMGTLKTAVVPEPGLYVVTIEASESGTAHLKVTEYSGSDPVQVLHYPEIPLSASGIASITFQEVTPEDAVEVDQDGDGQMDSLVFPLQAPVANAGSDQIAYSNVVVTLDALKSLPVNEGPLSYSWAQIAGPQVTLSNDSTPQPQFTALQVTVDTVLTFQLVVGDEFGASAPDTVAVTIKVPPAPPTLAAPLLSSAEVGVGYSAPLVTGGVPPYTFTLLKGVFPPGLSANTSTGRLTGTPTPLAKGGSFTVRITDQLGSSKTGTFRITIFKTLAISTNTLPAGTQGKAYKGSLKAAGGKKSYTWSLVSGNLPAGLTLNSSTGAITGIPTQAGPFILRFRITDPLGGQAQKNLTLTIN